MTRVQQFKAELAELLKKYDAEITLEDRGGWAYEKDPFIEVYLNAVYDADLNCIHPAATYEL
ncbi:MAG: hypothetical protein ABIN91_11100 [Mucilaginibacter sp.]|uniref:hypothetical protein n=1 Tax=Mucilaginibacter sp. TaxID=1882438 RepID=UPI00326561BA